MEWWGGDMDGGEWMGQGMEESEGKERGERRERREGARETERGIVERERRESGPHTSRAGAGAWGRRRGGRERNNSPFSRIL